MVEAIGAAILHAVVAMVIGTGLSMLIKVMIPKSKPPSFQSLGVDAAHPQGLTTMVRRSDEAARTLYGTVVVSGKVIRQ